MAHAATLGALIWAIVEYLMKPVLKDTGIPPKGMALLCTIVVGGVFYLLPGAQGVITFIGTLLTATLGAQTLHNLAVRPGEGGGGDSSGG